MPEAIRRERRQHSGQALRPTGVDPHLQRGWYSQARSIGSESDIMLLPLFPEQIDELVDQATGNPVLMLDMDGLDGPNPLK